MRNDNPKRHRGILLHLLQPRCGGTRRTIWTLLSHRISPLAATAIAPFREVPLRSARLRRVLLTGSEILAVGRHRRYPIAPLQSRVAAAIGVLEVPDKAALVTAPRHRIRHHHVPLVGQLIQRADPVRLRLALDDIHRELAAAQFPLVVGRQFPRMGVQPARQP